MKSSTALLPILTLFVVATSAAQAGEERRGRRLEKARAEIVSRFEKADVNADGQLSRDEAQAGMPRVFENFDSIDAEGKGFLTLSQIESYLAGQMKSRMEQRQGTTGLAM